MKNSIAILIPYFGKLPNYFPFFVESCRWNKFIDFIIFTDDKSADKFTDTNIKIHSFSKTAFSKLATDKLQHPFILANGYKLCDLKPMYGRVFEDYIHDYKFWGFSDIDIIMGDLSRLVTPKLLNEYDVISFYDKFISGPFCLFRNVESVNRLYTLSKDYKKILDDGEYCCFDEAATMEVMWQLWKGTPILETNSPIETFSHVVLNPEKCKLKLYFHSHIRDEELVNENVYFDNGKLYFEDKEIVIFHYLSLKGKISFNMPGYITGRKFYLSKNGFFYDSLKSKTVDWLSSSVDNFSQKAKRKIKRYF